MDLIKDAGDAREFKARLKDWESPTEGGLSSIWSGFTSFFFSKESTSGINEAVRKGRDIKDREFLAALQEKVFKEPLLEQLAQDVVKEAQMHFQGFIRNQLPKLHSRAHEIMQGRMRHQVEAQEKDQDQKRRALSRNVWFDAINIAQAQVVPEYVYIVYRCVQHRSSISYRSQDMLFVWNVEEVGPAWGQLSKSPNSLTLITFILPSTEYKLAAEITKYSPALLEYRVHNLSLTSDSRQDLQLDPRSIPSLHIETRFSYKFCLPAQHTIL